MRKPTVMEVWSVPIASPMRFRGATDAMIACPTVTPAPRSPAAIPSPKRVQGDCAQYHAARSREVKITLTITIGFRPIRSLYVPHSGVATNMAREGSAMNSPVHRCARSKLSSMSSWRNTGTNVIANVHSRKTKNIASQRPYSVRRQCACSAAPDGPPDVRSARISGFIRATLRIDGISLLPSAPSRLSRPRRAPSGYIRRKTLLHIHHSVV